MMETKVKIIERVGRDSKIVDVSRSYNMNCSTINDSKEQGQDHGTCEVCCANDVNSNIEEAWKSDRGDEEISQFVDAGSASVSSPTQLNVDSRES